MVIHYVIRAGRAACGANQGVKYRNRVSLTTAPARVTCVACQRLVLGTDRPLTEREQTDIAELLKGGVN